ncbi:MAG TPA: hypothetical protein VGQ39_08235 [Pyrinomonadaceae bacterium]|jgi:hypothetical protein|nr:hypothetical protein [Pyrinomonadaceae bacterium]
MYKFKNSLIGLIGLLSLVTIATVALPHVGRGAGSSAPTSQTQNVRVVNTGSEPVPIVGNTTVNGTVQAQQSGSWNVGINGTPTVGLDFSNNTVKFDAVNNTVKIDPTNPLAVRNVDNPARQPFQADAPSIGEFQPGQGIAFANITTVPQGKRFVIEQVSIMGGMLPGQKMLTAGIEVLSANQNNTYYLTITPQGTNSGGFRDIYVASQQVRLYADPGTNVYGVATRDNTTGFANAAVTWTISGYLVDLP